MSRYLRSIQDEYDDDGNYIGNSEGGNRFHGVDREPDRPGRPAGVVSTGDTEAMRRRFETAFPDHAEKGGSYEKCRDCGHKFVGRPICALIACKDDLWHKDGSFRGAP